MKGMYRALRGMNKMEIDTPALLIDLDVMESNLDRMALNFAGGSARLRPHAKTHKAPIIAHQQLRRGARGVTCAKLSEAEAMVQAGIEDILVANQVVGAPKLRLLVDLARHARITVAVDHPFHVEQLADAAHAAKVTVGVLVEVDVGMGRCGVRSIEEAVALAKLVDRARGLIFEGLQGYEGHCVFIVDQGEREKRANLSYQVLARTAEELKRHGLPPRVISGGGTGTFALALKAGILNEVQAGSYVFMDGRYSGIEGVGFGCALSVLTTVISKPDEKRLVTDCGLKAVSTDFGLPRVKGVDEMNCLQAAEEHLLWELTSPAKIGIGNKLEILPSHGCTTVNLHDDYYCVRNGILETVWPIAGRGKTY
jgi:D-serine deaminase-like pyridoxal phosphate-dependent protein